MTTTIEQPHAYRLQLPSTWTEAAERLGISRKSLIKSKQALGFMDSPLDSRTYESLRVMSEFVARRNSGGGSSCRRQEFVRLQIQGGLAERLTLLGITFTDEVLESL